MTTPPAPPADRRAPAPAQRGRASRLVSPVGAAALAVAGAVALHLRDPHVDGSWGRCPSALLGFWCPLCGGLRAVHDLTNLDLGAAASSNLLVVLALPVVVLLWSSRVMACWRGGAAMVPVPVRPCVWWALGIVAGGFMLLRNLPAGGWLAP